MPPMTERTRSDPRVRRGVFFLDQAERAQWERACAIAREQSRDEAEARELLGKAMRLALEQHIARAGGGA